MTIRGHDRAIDGGRDRCVAEDHEAAGAQDDRPAADSSAENWKGVEDMILQMRYIGMPVPILTAWKSSTLTVVRGTSIMTVSYITATLLSITKRSSSMAFRLSKRTYWQMMPIWAAMEQAFWGSRQGQYLNRMSMRIWRRSNRPTLIF